MSYFWRAAQVRSVRKFSISVHLSNTVLRDVARQTVVCTALVGFGDFLAQIWADQQDSGRFMKKYFLLVPYFNSIVILKPENSYKTK